MLIITNEDKILLKKTALWLQKFHCCEDVDFEKILTPFVYCYLAYYKKYFKEGASKNSIEEAYLIPEDNGALVFEFEKRGKLLDQLINFKKPNKRSLFVTCKSNMDSKKGYIFPYSPLLNIAFLSFLNKINQIIFFIASIGKRGSCNFQNSSIDSPVMIMTREALKVELRNKTNLNSNFIDSFVLFIPKCYIEDFSTYRYLALNEYIKMIKIKKFFFIRRAFFNPTFLILLGMAAKKGKSLITFQHGGTYGQVYPGWSALAEKEMCTKFFTWGYSHDNKDEPFCSLRHVKKIIKKIKSNSKHKVLVVLPLIDDTGLHGDTSLAINNSLSIILKMCNRDEIDFKPHPHEQNIIKVKELLSSRGINNKIILIRDLNQLFSYYKSIIFTSPTATGFLDAIVEGYRPIMIFDKLDFEIKEESKKFYHSLSLCGIWINSTNCDDYSVLPFPELVEYEEFKNQFLRLSYFPTAKLFIKLLFMK